MNKSQRATFIAKAILLVVLILPCWLLGNYLLKPATDLLLPYLCSFPAHPGMPRSELELMWQLEQASCDRNVQVALFIGMAVLYSILAFFGLWAIDKIDEPETGSFSTPTSSATSYQSSSSVSSTGYRSDGGSYRQTLAERMKDRVGMEPHGTTGYWRNAAKVLSQYATPGSNTLRADTRAKLEALSHSSDPETRAIARNALNGQRYDPDDDDDDNDDD